MTGKHQGRLEIPASPICLQSLGKQGEEKLPTAACEVKCS